MKKAKFSKNKQVYIFLTIFIIIIIFLIIQNTFLVNKIKKDNTFPDSNLTESKIENSSLEYQLNDLNFTNNEIPIEITELNALDLETLKNKYPVIYQKAEEGFYYIKFPSWIVIYDFNNKLVVDKFRFQSVNIQ